MITPDRIRDIARQIITDNATDIDFDTVRRVVAAEARKGRHGLTPAERQQLARNVDDLIGKAVVTVSWPANGQNEPLSSRDDIGGTCEHPHHEESQ